MRNIKNKILLTTLLAASVSVSAEKLTVFELQYSKIQNMLGEKSINPNHAGTAVTVGSTDDCDFSLGATRIQDAIDSVPMKSGWPLVSTMRTS